MCLHVKETIARPLILVCFIGTTFKEKCMISEVNMELLRRIVHVHNTKLWCELLVNWSMGIMFEYRE